MAAKEHTKKIRAILSALKVSEDDKETIISSFTGGRTTHITELHDSEAINLVNRLRAELKKPAKPSGPESDEQVKDRMRKKIISKYREMHFYKLHPVKGFMIADMPRINAEVKEHWHKDLNDYTVKELAEIISVLETKILPWWYEKQKLVE